MAEIQDLPRWVWDLLADLIDEERVHPKLFFTSGAFEGYRPYAWCPAAVLAKVPTLIRDRAGAIAEYRQPAPDSEPASEDPEEQLGRLRAVADAAIAWRSQFTKPNDTKFPRRGALIRAVDRLTEGSDTPEEQR